MKREIKFRAWDESFGTMVYDIDPDHYEVYFNGNQLTCRSIDGNGDPFTLPLLQFTGLHDKNGKEIYEGDILDFDEREWGGRFKPEVIWMENIIGDWNYCGSLSDVREWRKVIGNIYENPELLSK